MARYDSPGVTYDDPGLFYDQDIAPEISGDPVGWTATGGGNHGGEDWVITEDTVIAGVHRNVGRWSIEVGVLVTVLPYDGAAGGELEVRARSIEIAGGLVASTFGYRGGAAASAGEGPFGGAAGIDGGYLAGAGQGDSSTDTSGVKGSGGGGGSTLPGGAGGGLVQLFALASLRIRATARIFSHGGIEGEASAGHGAGGAIVIHCDGPYGVERETGSVIGTLGGGTQTANGGTFKEFSLPGRLVGSGTASTGRTYSDTTLRRAGIVA